MTLIVGNVADVGLDGLDGTLKVWAGFRPEATALIAPRPSTYDVVDGVIPPGVEVIPGPAVLDLDFGVSARTQARVMIPDQATVTIQDLFLHASIWEPWRPYFMEDVADTYRRAIEALARAEAALGDADTSVAAVVAAEARVGIEHEHIHQDAAHVDAVAALVGELLEQANVFSQDQVPPYLQKSSLDREYARMSTGPGDAQPAGFRGLDHLPVPQLVRDGSTVTGEVDLDALRPPEGVTYWTSPTAAQSGPTGTKADPLAIGSILAKPDVGTIRLAPGEYPREMQSFTPTRSVNWIADGPGVYLTGFNRTTATVWALVSGHIYSTSRSATGSVVDVQNLTSWGDFTVYAKKADLASITGPGQWAIVGSVVYVWALGNTNLTVSANREQIRLQVSSMSGVVAINTTQYVEGVEFWGCSNNAGVAISGGLISYAGGLLLAKDCKIKYNMADNGASTKGGHAIFVNVEASSNAMDGFNYHDTQNLGAEFLEIGCHSHHNGLPSVGSTTTGSHNGSTAHEAVTGIRVGGRYEHAAGPVVADVNSAHTWNVGCYAGGQGPGVSIHVSQDTSWRVDATGFDADPAQMWLESCEAAVAPAAYRISGPGAIWVANSTETNATRAYAETVVGEYEPGPSVGVGALVDVIETGRLSSGVLNDTYLLKGEMPTIPDVAAPPITTGILGGLSLLGDSTGRGTYSGDSEPGIGGATVMAHSMSWLTWATRMSRGRLTRGVNASVIGDTLNLMLARIQSDVINHPLRIGTAVAVCSGYNDAYYELPTATYMERYAAIHQILAAAQIEMIACTPLPTANSPALNARMADYSVAIRAYAKKHGLFLLDLRALTIHTDGGLIPSVKSNGDGVHPGAAGQMELGKIVYGALRNRLARFGTAPVNLWGANGNLTPNRTFEGTPDAMGRPPSVFTTGSNNAAVVPTVVPGAGLIAGNWFRITHTASTVAVTYTTRIPSAAGKIAVGDRIAIAGIAAITGNVRLFVMPQWGPPYRECAIRTQEASFDPMPFYAEFTVPPSWNGTHLDINIETGAAGEATTGVVDLAQLSVYNLTKNPALAG